MDALEDYDPDGGLVGYLTYDEWDRFLRAWTTGMKNLSWWWVAGHIRGGEYGETRRASGDRPLPLPATWLAAHEITRLMNELNRWPELEDAVHDVFGQDLAKLLTREVETAAAKWPSSDRSHKVRFMRCMACDQQTLRYLPPNLKLRADAPQVDVAVRVGGKPHHARRRGEPPIPREYARQTVLDVAVRCTDKACGAVMDHTMFQFAVEVIRTEHERLEQRRLDSRRGSAGEGEPEPGDGLSVGAVGSGSVVETGPDASSVGA